MGDTFPPSVSSNLAHDKQLMARPIAINKEGVSETPEVQKGARELRWDAYLENYSRKNPVKFADKKEKGAFNEIPVSFK